MNISVIVPNYNYNYYLEKRIESILKQNYPIQEIIVLDDASSDESLHTVAGLSQKCSIPLMVVPSDRNSGSVFKQWIRGICLAQSEWIWIAEADDLSDPDFLSSVIRPVLEDKEIVLSYCLSRIIDAEGKIVQESYRYTTDDIDPEKWKHPYIREGVDEIRDTFAVKNTIPNVSSCIFRKPDNLEEIATKLEKYRVAGDWYFYMELLKHGKIAYTPEILNSYRRHGGSVVSSGKHNLIHYRELVSLQESIAEVYDVSPETRNIALAHRADMKRWLSIYDERIENYSFIFTNRAIEGLEKSSLLLHAHDELWRIFTEYREIERSGEASQVYEYAVDACKKFVETKISSRLKDEKSVGISLRIDADSSFESINPLMWFLYKFFPASKVIFDTGDDLESWKKKKLGRELLEHHKGYGHDFRLLGKRF